MTRPKAVVVICVMLALAGVSAHGYFTKPGIVDGAFAFETAAVSKGDVRKAISTTGIVRPRTTVQVGSELSGRVKEIVADFNTVVKAGDLLAVIEPRTFEAKAKQARADLLSAEAALTSGEAAVRKALSMLVNAEAVSKRQQALGLKGIASRVNVDGSERDLNVAKAEIDAAKANVENARALVVQKAAQLEQAEIDLERTRIKAPISGVILHRSVDVGQTVAASFQAPELFRIAGDLSNVHIEAQVSEVDVGSVKIGQRVSFHVDAYANRTFDGTVEQIRLSPVAADSVVTYAVIIGADNAKSELFPGMTAHVRIETAARADVMRVAIDALRFKPPKDLRKPVRRDGLPFWERGRALVRAALNGTSPPASAELDQVPRDTIDATVKRWRKRLELDDKQSAELRSRLAEASSRAQTPTAGKRPETKASGRKGTGGDAGLAAVEDSLEAILGPDQKAKLAAFRAAREATQRATVWLLSQDGELEKRTVRVGLTDVKYAEVVEGELNPGDGVVVRSRKVKQQ